MPWNQAGATVVVTGLLPPPSGTTHLIMVTDPRGPGDENSLAESDEDNNVLAVKIGEITEPPPCAGDANRDGVFDTGDLVQVFQAGEYEDGIPRNSTWEEGDWNGDGDFTTGDLVTAFQAGCYERPRAAAIEPIVQHRDLEVAVERHTKRTTLASLDAVFATESDWQKALAFVP